MMLDANGHEIEPINEVQEAEIMETAAVVDMNNIKNQPSNLKIPIFIGINDPIKLNQVLEIVKDDELYEVGIISASRYKEMIIEYQFSKMTQDQKENFDKFKANEEAKSKFNDLVMEMHDCGYKSFNRDQLKQFMRLHRKKALSNKEADGVIDALFAFKNIEVINTTNKEHERDYKLLITIDDEMDALDLKKAAINNEVNILNAEIENIKDRMKKLKYKAQDAIEHNTANLTGISDDIRQKSDK